MRFLVTGSNGFIGSGVCRVAAQAGGEVLGISRSSSPSDGFVGEYLHADVATADLTGVIRDFQPDAVVHASGGASVAASMKEPLEDFKGSVVPWANVLEAVRKSGTNPLVFFTGSAAIYGNGTEEPLREDRPPLPISPYGFHKQLCETLAREYSECHGLSCVSLRLFSVFGPRQKRLLIWDIFQKLKSTSDTLIFDGTGQETRDYLLVDEVADALLRLARILPRKPGLHLLNVARGSSTSIRSLCQTVLELLEVKKTPQFSGQVRPGDPQKWSADTRLLRQHIPDWKPTDLPLTLRECFNHWQKQS